MKQLKLGIWIPLLATFLSACAMGPDYKRPPVADLPHDWRWKQAEPKDELPKGPWWTVFNDPTLNQLEQQAVANNSNFKAALARFQASRAQARVKESDFFPDLTLDSAYSRTQAPKNIPQFQNVPLFQPAERFKPYNSFSVAFDLNYEVDLWGRVRRSYEAAQAVSQASQADCENILLSITADVALYYFRLRQQQAEIDILSRTEQSRKKQLEIIQTRIQAGRSTELDVAQAQTNFTNVSAELAAQLQQKASTETALAVLCDSMPGEFVLSVKPLDDEAPSIPVGLPSSLLERRPDIAIAERNMEAANAEIGVAQAAFFPTVTLTGQGGYLSASASNLFTWQNSVWGIGPSVSIPIFEGGRNSANFKTARAYYQQSVDNYRTAVLQAVKDVEDSLSAIVYLEKQRQNLDASVNSAQKASSLAHDRFIVGQTDYTDITVAEQIQLAAERSQSIVRGQQFYATIHLIKAMGGGWNSPLSLTNNTNPTPIDLDN